jgi:hypothetical protein
MNAAVEQGSAEAVGTGAALGLRGLGKGIYRGGVALLPRTLKQEFATEGVKGGKRLADAGFRENIALTGRGAEKAERLQGEVGGQVSDELARMQRMGAPPIDVRTEIEPALSNVARRVKDEPFHSGDQRELVNLRRMLRKETPKQVQLGAAQPLKQGAQRKATNAYKQQARGTPIRQIEADASKEIGQAWREAIERRADVGPLNTRIQDLIGLERGADQASQTGHILSRMLGAGGAATLGSGGGLFPAALAAGAGGMLTTPGGLTRAGLGVKGLGEAAWYSPDIYRLALIAQLADETK